MVNRDNDMAEREAAVQAVMKELGVSRQAAALLLTIESGNAFIDDIVFEWTTDPAPTESADRRPPDERPLAAESHRSAENDAAAPAATASGQATGRPRSARRASSAA